MPRWTKLFGFSTEPEPNEKPQTPTREQLDAARKAAGSRRGKNKGSKFETPKDIDERLRAQSEAEKNSRSFRGRWLRRRK